MRRHISLAGLAVLLATPTYATPNVAMSAAVQRDVQCFVLYSIAVESADSSDDEKTKQAGSLGMMYFFGKIKVSAPDLNFVEAVRQEANAFDSNPQTEAIAKACDVEFQKRGAELIDVGRQLQQTPPQSSSSS